MKSIEHEGIVEKVFGNHVTVKIISESACASCEVKGACTMSGSQEKEIDVISLKTHKVGDHVRIVGTSSQGLKAAWLAYILPVALVLSALIITWLITGNENLSGLIALLVLVPYFFIIRMSEKAMQKTFSFTIKTKNE